MDKKMNYILRSYSYYEVLHKFQTKLVRCIIEISTKITNNWEQVCGGMNLTKKNPKPTS